MHGVHLGGVPKEPGEGRAEVRLEGEAESKGLVITPVTTMGTGGWISRGTSGRQADPHFRDFSTEGEGAWCLFPTSCQSLVRAAQGALIP